MKQSLERRIAVFAFAIISMTILASTAMEIIAIRKDYINEINLRAETIGTSLKSSIEKVLALGINIPEIVGLEDRCRESITSDPDMSFCVISDLNGKVLYYSEKQPGTLFSTNNQNKTSRFSIDKQKIKQITLNSEFYYYSLTPVQSFDSSTVAYIQIGFPQKAVDSKVHPIITRSVIVFFIFFSISFATVIHFVNKCIVSPISILLDSVNRVSQGDYTVTIQKMPILEFDELAQNINNMSQSLDSRGKELKKNYDELTETHSHLHDSYSKLELLSAKLEKSEELFKNIIEESSDAIIILDKTEHLLIANKKASHLLSLPANDIIGQHISGVLLSIQAEDISQLLGTISRAHCQPASSIELVFLHNHQQRIANLNMCSISQGDKQLLQLIFHDITREKEIIRNLEQSAAGLARLNKMKDSFLGLASHELKTPLTVILGYSELLLNEMNDQLSENAKEMVSSISNAGMRLDGIVKDMIDISMLDQKQLKLKLTDLNINSLVEHTIHELRFFFSIRNLRISVYLDPALPQFNGDKSRLIQLLTNVIGNAIKFTPDGGNITVSTKLKTFSHNWRSDSFTEAESSQITQGDIQAIEISILDTGIGISKEDQLKIFDKFFEAGDIEEHSTGKVAFKSRGTGLGLSIAKGIAEAHGGQIWVESAGYDQLTLPGSTFYIMLPIRNSEKESE